MQQDFASNPKSGSTEPQDAVLCLKKIKALCQAVGDQEAKKILQKFAASRPAEFAHWLSDQDPQQLEQLNKSLSLKKKA